MSGIDQPALPVPGKAHGSDLQGPRKPRRSRHAYRCSICQHPDRDAIEEAFIHWHSPSDIAIDYHLPDRSAVYRHARATGLFSRRKRNLRFVLERLLERVDKVKVTAPAIVRAVRAYTRINDRGEWIDPPTRVLIVSGSAPFPDRGRGEQPRNRAEAREITPGPGQQKLIEGRRTKTRSILIATRAYSREEPTH